MIFICKKAICSIPVEPLLPLCLQIVPTSSLVATSSTTAPYESLLCSESFWGKAKKLQPMEVPQRQTTAIFGEDRRNFSLASVLTQTFNLRLTEEYD